MQLHDLLLELVMDGLSGEWRVHNIECAKGHVCGYAKVPLNTKPWPIVAFCNACQEPARIGGTVARKAEQVLDKPDETPPPPTPPPVAPTVELPKPQAEPAKNAKAVQALVKARAIGEEKRIEKQIEIEQAVEKNIKTYTKPTAPLKALNDLIAKTPYSKMNADILFSAIWLAKDTWGENCVPQLHEALGCTEGALRCRIENAWRNLPVKLQLLMPYVANMCQRNAKYRKLIEAAQVRHKETQPPRPAPTVKMPEPVKPPESNWRTLNKVSK